jgi:predicted PurR-regulated permease PerM
MGKSSNPVVDPELQRTVVVLAMRVAVVALVAYWCFRIFQPFLMVVVWGIILAVALDPVVGRVTRWVGGRRRLAVTLLVLLGLAALLVPAFVLSDSLVEGVQGLTAVVESGSVEIPPPPVKVADWPVIGDVVYETWSLASQNVGAALEKFAPQVKAFAVFLISLVKGLAGALLLTIVAAVIAVVLQVRREWALQAALRFGAGFGGERGVKLVRFAGATIGTVAKGVVGVAVIQASLAAVGLVLAGVPGAGLWSVIILVLAVAQLPPLVVLAPAMLYVASTSDSTLGVIAFVVWSVLVSLSDAVLKPLFMGRGTEIPGAVILVGAIGGLMLHGVIGLFVGAVVFSIGYDLIREWIATQEKLAAPAAGGAAAPSSPAGEA